MTEALIWKLLLVANWVIPVVAGCLSYRYHRRILTAIEEAFLVSVICISITVLLVLFAASIKFILYD